MISKCYECENDNHVDCVLLKIRSNVKECGCWCSNKDTKYYKLHINKRSGRLG